MTNPTVEPSQNGSIWMRALYMLIFLFLMGIAKFVTIIVVIAQFLTVLVYTKPNEKLLTFGRSLSDYQYQILLFVTYNSEEHPYPMGDWPESDHIETTEPEEK